MQFSEFRSISETCAISVHCRSQCGTILGPPDQRIDLGETEVPSEMFYEYLQQLGEDAFR